MSDDYLEILRTLKDGGNPTPPTSSIGGITSIEHDGMSTTNFGLSSVNENQGPDSE